VPRGKSTTSKINGNGAKTNNGAKLGFEQTLWAAIRNFSGVKGVSAMGEGEAE
jgi:hypothetical protein